MKHYCPNCRRVLYNRRLKCCGYCGASIPEELRFTPEESAALDHELAVIELFHQRRMNAEEVTDLEFHDPQIFYPFYL
jgi:hypothetical protein